jgi:FkbM family methyltransferase
MTMEYSSQIGQDKFIDDFFDQKEGLTFLDIGAHDGISLSNTYFLEKERKWTGICIEAQPLQFEKLKQNRSCICINEAVSNFEGETSFTYVEGYEEGNYLSGITSSFHHKHLKRIQNEVSEYGGVIKETKVPVRRVQSILDQYNIKKIDFCSIDTEGSEFEIVKSIDFKKTDITVLIIENSFHAARLTDYMDKKGFYLLKKIKYDDIYVQKPKRKSRFWPFG